MINSVNSTILQNIDIENSDGVKTAIAVKMLKAEQESQKIVGDIIQDTVDISNEAIDAYNAEKA